MKTLPLSIFLLALAGASQAAPKGKQNAVERWNRIAIDASGFDHTPAGAGEQIGPCRSSRAMAIVHVAMLDAIAAATGQVESYTGVTADRTPLSLDAAICQAAHDTLAALFPSQAAQFADNLATDLNSVNNLDQKEKGIELGQRTALAILLLRAADGSQHAEPLLGVDHLTSDLPGRWRQDPISLVPIALGGRWPGVTPFVLSSAAQFRLGPPPALDSAEYTAAFDEAKRLGGDGVTTPTERTEEQTFIGTFWAYDGTPSLCAPPRLYNQIAAQIARQKNLNMIETARLLGLVNVAMADAGIAAWDSKYYWDYWRPVTGIREADPGTGPSLLGDGNDDTIGDDTFSPLGAPASNLNGPDFTPPFPAYPSGHATFGGALFQILRRYCGTDRIKFKFVSDEFNGTTRDNDGNVRPLIPRKFDSLSEAEEENGQSRIYLGIHWAFDKTAGIAQGNQVADLVFDSIFQKRRPPRR